MELIFSIFQAYSTAKDVAHAYETISDWVIDVVSRWGNKAPAGMIDKQVQRMAAATDSDIRRAAAKAFQTGNGSAIPHAEREELIGILINMARNVRFRASFGSLDGTFLRSERLLDTLLTD